MFSDDIHRSGGSQSYSKRMRYQSQNSLSRQPASSSHARTKVRNGSYKASSWKKSYRLPESSPAYHTRHANFPSAHVPSLSFVSETSTVPDDLASPLSSEEDDADLPIHSFNLTTARSEVDRLPTIHSSPPPRSPRTPPPTLARSARLKNKAFTAAAQSRNPHNGEDGAELLMFLATSPGPTRTPTNRKGQFLPPSTPPSKATPLPSSMMNTPGGLLGLQTPGMQFNFADYLNVTPSPAQVAWKTPGTTRTPGPMGTSATTREARRRLNFDGMAPPTNAGPDAKVTGLGMELGGELVSS